MFRSKLFVAILSLVTVSPGMVSQETATPSPAAAVVPEGQRATEEQLSRLFDVMRIKQQMASATQMMPQMMKHQFDQSMKAMEQEHPEMGAMTAEQREASAKVLAKFTSKAMTLYSTDEMMADMRKIYGRHLTSADIDATIVFYQSPAGQHMLDMVPAIMQEFLPAMMEKLQAKMRPLILEMSKEMVEIAQSSSKKN